MRELPLRTSPTAAQQMAFLTNQRISGKFQRTLALVVVGLPVNCLGPLHRNELSKYGHAPTCGQSLALWAGVAVNNPRVVLSAYSRAAFRKRRFESYESDEAAMEKCSSPPAKGEWKGKYSVPAQGGARISVYKGGRNYSYSLVHRGSCIQRSTHHSDGRAARQLEPAHKIPLAKGEVGILESRPAPTLKDLSQGFLDNVGLGRRRAPANLLRCCMRSA